MTKGNERERRKDSGRGPNRNKRRAVKVMLRDNIYLLWEIRITEEGIMTGNKEKERK